MGQTGAERRQRGSVRKRGDRFQIRVYAGQDPVTGRPHYLTESVGDEKQADRILRRLLTEVDEQRNARTKATLGTAIDSWLRVHDAEASTLDGYEIHARLYVRPALGDVPVGKVSAQMLEELYAQLRRCRVRCDGRPFIEHRVDGPHECRVVKHRRPPGRRPAAGHPPHDCVAMNCEVIECSLHVCRPLAQATLRQVHNTVSGALSAAVRWEWIKSNPAAVARKPRQPYPDPGPPTPEEAARIVAAAWEYDEDWGAFVWLVMVTGMRRAEALALRWGDVDLDRGILDIRRNYVWVRGRGVEKDTKTHRMRRIALDPDTVEMLRAHRERHQTEMRSLGVESTDQAFLFSASVQRNRPYNPHTVSHRYRAMCTKFGIDSHIHALRDYSATELLTAGVDLRTVAGRLGHAGGGATTLRVYAAWVSASDRKAADILGSRMKRPQPPSVLSDAYSDRDGCS